MIRKYICHLLVTVCTLACTTQAAELQHRYDFYNNVSDKIGGAHGTLAGGATVSGGAVHMDGSGGYVDLPDGLVAGYDDITIETWLTDHGSGTWARIFDFGDSTSVYMFLSPLSGADTLRGAITTGSGEQVVEWSGTSLPTGSPVHVVWTYDNGSNTGKLYVDGSLVAENNSITLRPSDMGWTANNWIGRSQWPDPYLNASIDEFRIYDGALTLAEVQQNFVYGPDALAFGPVSLISHPVSQSMGEARPVTFAITYSGTPPVSVQWYRNGSPVSGATETSYTIEHAPLSDNGALFHAVVANAVSGTPYSDTSTSATLTVTADTTAPTLDGAVSIFPNGVRVTFSEEVDNPTATDPSNYSITHDGGTLAVTVAEFADDASTILLTTAFQTLETLYTLHVSNVQDLSDAANTIAPDSQFSFIASSYITDDIGSPVVESIAASVDNGIDLTAAGSGIGGNSDQFGFSHKSYTGNFDMQIRLAGMEFNDAWARAGLMARDGLNTDDIFAAIFSTAGPVGCHFSSRASTGGTAAMTGYFPSSFPDMWLRLRRTGNFFEGYAGVDGSTWQRLGSATIAMSGTVEVGLALSSGESATAITAEFRDESNGGGTIVPSIGLPFEPLGPSSRRGAMVISEIMVDTPAEWGGTNSLEFIELYNSGLITEDLTGHRFSGEIDYTFPAGTLLTPGEFAVVAKDPAAAQSYYGVTCYGPYEGKLANGGGTLRFRNELNGILLEVEYNNKEPWPVAAFGSGHSLVLSHPSYGEGDARAWSASDRIGGSPGTTDGYGAEPARGVVINEYLAHTDLPHIDYIELFNNGTTPVDLSGAWLSDDITTNKYRIPNGTILGARGFLSFDQNDLGFALAADGEEIFLVNSNQTRVINAITFRGQDNGVAEGRYPDGAPNFQELSSVTEGSANTAPLLRPVVINEIMYHPISESNDDEYIELYNRTGSPVDLSNWRLQGGISYQFPENTEIPAYGFLVVAENATNLIAKYTQLNASNTYGNYGGALNNSSDSIRLSFQEDLISTNGSGLVVTNLFYIPIDEVTYQDGGRWGDWSDGGGSSLELIDPDADNRQPASWADSDETAKAPWTTIDVTEVLENGQGTPDRVELYMQGAGEVLLDDIEFRNNSGANWVSNGDFSSGSNGWAFGGVVRDSYVDNGAGLDGSAALRLISTARGDVSCNNADHVLDNTASTGGSNMGTLRANVRWQKGASYFMMRVRGQYMEASLPIQVPSNCGTPGQANSRRVTNAGPAIYDVAHSPALPASGEAVVVTARAVDPDGIASLTLRYRIDPSSSFSSATMRDNGNGGDAIAGDGIYSANISGRSSGTLAAFYVQASDGSAATQFPAAAPDRECLVRWGEANLSGSIGTYRLWMTQDNINFWGNREKNANDTIDATFVYGNQRVVYNVDTMYSGSPFHTPAYNGPNGSFPCDYEINFHPGERFLGAEPFVLSGEGSDSGSFWFDTSTQVDLTSTWIGRGLGQQYNYRRHVHMMLNGNQRGMIYLDTQQPNGDMLDQYHPNDSNGDLRKVEDWMEFESDNETFSYITATLEPFNKSGGGVDAKRYRWNWRPRATKSHDQWFAFTNMVAAINDTGAANYENRARVWMDMRNFIRPVAVNRICGNWDSYGYERGKNMYVYKPDDQGWRMLLWDIELALGNGSRGTNDPITDFHDPALSSLITDTPAFYREYLLALQEAVDGPMLASNANPILDERYANLLANGIAASSPAGIKSYISDRRTYLQSVLPSASFAVDGSPSFSVSTNSIALSGTAPLQVAEVLINGIPYPIEWTSTTTWRLTLPLSAGLNNLSVTGVDSDGAAVDRASATLNVTYTGTELDPTGVVVLNEIHPSPEDRDLQFVELFNTDETSVFDLSGWRINGIGYTFPTGSVLCAGEYLVLVNNPYRFASQENTVIIFDSYAGSLDPQGETLTLYRQGTLPDQEVVVDRVRYESAAPWAAALDGSSLQLIDASRDNSRAANWASAADTPPAAPVNIVNISNVWKYYQEGYPGAGWQATGFNDTLWPSGNALLYAEDAPLPAATNSPLTLGQTAYYFRTTFNYSGSTANVMLDLSTVVDDGIILYLNGEEIYRLGMEAGTVTHSSAANRVIGEAQYEGPFAVAASALRFGQNVLAAEVHQQAPDSSDIVFGVTLDVVSGGSVATTPGSQNSVAKALPDFPEIWLNELQADNTTGPQDNAGDHDPWLEIYNAGSSAFSLDGYYLTDAYGTPTQWAFPAGTTVPASGFLVIWCDAEPDESVAGAPHADFALTSSIGQIGLVRMVSGIPQVVDYLNYTNLLANWSYGDIPDGQPFYRDAMFYATPGLPNSGTSAPITASINEWMADNDGTVSDPADGSYEDWFEIYNPGSNTVDLGGYYLTDDLTDPFQFEIPNNGHYTIAPGGFLLVWADGETGQNSTNRTDLHVNFSLSKNGESIGLHAGGSTVIDTVTFGAQATDVSEGRFPDAAAGIYVMAPATPRAANQVVNTAPIFDAIADVTLTLGQTLTFTATATDHDVPAQMLTFSLAGAPAGATIHPSTGAFSWQPDTAPSTNTLAVVVTDSGAPNLSDTEWFTVKIVPQPVLGTIAVAGSDLSFTWPSVHSQPYQVYYKDELMEVYWNPIGSLLIGTGEQLIFTNHTDDAEHRFFIIGLEP